MVGEEKPERAAMSNDKADFKGLDKSVRKQKVLTEATGVFHRKGYRTATLDDVALRLGVTKAALYYYFSSKEAILSTIYIQAIDNALEHARLIEALDAPPPEKLRSFLKSHVQHVIIDNLPVFAVFFSEENQLPDEHLQEIRRAKREYNRVVEELINQGVVQGHFRPADPAFMANCLLGLCNSLYHWYRPDKDDRDADRFIDDLVSFMENGYLLPQTPGGRPPAPAREDPDRDDLDRKEALEQEMKRHRRVLARLLDRTG